MNLDKKSIQKMQALLLLLGLIFSSIFFWLFNCARAIWQEGLKSLLSAQGWVNVADSAFTVDQLTRAISSGAVFTGAMLLLTVIGDFRDVAFGNKKSK